MKGKVVFIAVPALTYYEWQAGLKSFVPAAFLGIVFTVYGFFFVCIFIRCRKIRLYLCDISDTGYFSQRFTLYSVLAREARFVPFYTFYFS